MPDRETLRLHRTPVLTQQIDLCIRSGDFDIELDQNGSKASLWLGWYLIARWYAGDGKIHWLGGTEGL